MSELDLNLDLAVNVIKSGGIVIFPTSSVYGLACNATNLGAIKKIFLIKKRTFDKPISIIIPSIAEVFKVSKFISQKAMDLMKKFWPGRVTFIVEACDEMFPNILIAGTGKVGIRVPLNIIANILVKNCGFPITATSANISGQPSAACINNIDHEVLNAVDLVINIGHLSGRHESTIVDTTVDPIKVLREGELLKSEFN